MHRRLFTETLKRGSRGSLTVLSIVASALILTGCGSLTKHSQEKNLIPANLLNPCRPLTPLSGKTGADVVRKFVEIGEQYNECAAGKGALIEAVKG